MFRKSYMMILSSEEKVDSITKIAANNNLHCLYKIGVYGAERQHELFITGTPWNYWKFKKELSEPNRKK